MPKIAVIGLGRFGMALARQLGASGAQVMAIDRNQQLVNEIRDDVDVAVKLDSTDRAALESQELQKADACVIAVGENFETALLTTVIARKLGVARIICRAQSEFHAEIFRQIGADEIIQPETEAGQHLAHRLANEHIADFITLGEGFTLIELRAPRAFHGKTLRALSLRQKYNVNLVAVRRPIPAPKTDAAEAGDQSEDSPPEPQEKIIAVPSAADTIQEDDILVLAGSDEALAKLPKE